ncbi:MAG: MarR family transcriptional regulator, partial [Microbacterium sp.]
MGDDDLLKLENQLCFAVVTAARNVVSLYRPVLEPLGLTHPQYLVMLAL